VQVSVSVSASLYIVTSPYLYVSMFVVVSCS
jgi:hypothetical protein